MAICFVRFLLKISHAHISFWILSQLVSSFWGRHFLGFCFFCQRSWWTEWQDYLRCIVSNSWWLHVWFLLSVLYPKRLLWNLFYHRNQCSYSVLTCGYFCSFTPSWILIWSWIFLDVTCTSSVWYLFVFWDSAVGHYLSFSASGSCRIFSAFFPHYCSTN